MVAAIVGAVGVAGSIYQGSQQSKAAGKAADQQAAAGAAQLKLGEDQLDFGKQQYQDWKDNFGGATKQLGAMAEQEVRPDYDAITADAGAAYDASNASASRNLERYGVNPNDGAFAAQQNGNALAKAATIVGTRNNARSTAQDKSFARLAAYVGAGSGQQQSANSLINAAYSGVNGAYNSQINQNGENARYNNGQAQNSWGDAFKGAGYLATKFGSGSSTTAPSAGSAGAFGDGTW